MEKIKDYFINFVLFLVYFIIVLFALVFNNSLGWFLLAFFTLYVSWSLISLSSFLKKLSVTCTLQPLVYRKKSMQVIFSIAKKRTFSLPFPRLQIGFPAIFAEKKQEILILTNKPQEVQLLWQPKERGCHETLTVIFTAYDSLGLFRKSAKREISFPVTVLPAFCKIQAEKLQRVLEKKQQLNAYQRGLDFREHRAYRPGDSFNRIDWKLSAHTQEWLYREYDYQEEECSPLFCFWGSHSPKFEPLLDLYFSLWHLRKEKQPELLILGNRAFHGKDPGHTYFASLEAGDEKAFLAHLKKYAKKQIVLFVPENSPEVSEAIETLSKDRTVYLVYFVEKQLMVQEKDKICSLPGGEWIDD
ncbi:TPA: DUF58 domain-containing protein [Enterococcus faecium]